MFQTDVSIPLAFGAGVLSFFSPCILPLIPAYIMYITGVSVEEDLQKKRLSALIKTLGFVLGFTIIFMIMGSSASFIGKVFIRNKDVFAKISGIIIMIFGLSMMGILNLKFINFNKRVKAPKKMTHWFSSILMGMAFAAGWTPCFGPVLASILIYAGGTATISKGVLLLFIYSMGMGLPFILTALFINVFIKFMEKAEKVLKYFPIVSGVIMVIFGGLIFFDKIKYISALFI